MGSLGGAATQLLHGIQTLQLRLSHPSLPFLSLSLSRHRFMSTVCHRAPQTRAWVRLPDPAIARPQAHAISRSWSGTRSSPMRSSALARNSMAGGSVTPGRAVDTKADTKASAQPLKHAMSERAPARSWDACPAASASSVANTAAARASASACVTACQRPAIRRVFSA